MLSKTTSWLKTYIRTLKARVPKNSGALSKSIKGNIVERDGDVVISIEALEYLEFLDKGVSGTEKKYNTPFSYTTKMPPTSAFKAYSNSLGEQFAIAKSIQKKGIKPGRFFESKLNNDLDDLPGAVVDDLLDGM